MLRPFSSCQSASSRRRLRNEVATDVRRWIPLLLLSLCLTTHAQTFTNSATLTAAREGTNLVVTYSLTTTQGWVTLFQAGTGEKLLTEPQPVDVTPAPAFDTGEFRVPLDPTATTRFYRLLMEEFPTRARALVFVNGPLDFDAMRQTYGAISNNPVPYYTNGIGQIFYEDFGTNSTPMIFKPPVQVWLDSLGNYDTNGVLIGGHGGVLNGKYGRTTMASIQSGTGFDPISQLQSGSNDFHVYYEGTQPPGSLLPPTISATPREAVLWSTEVQMYHDVNDYRKRFLNDAFIDELNLPTELATNLKQRQFRADLNTGSPPSPTRPILRAVEEVNVTGIRLFPIGNAMNVSLRTRGPYLDYGSRPPMSIAYDTTFTMGDYCGLVAFWVLGTNTGFPSEFGFGGGSEWQSNMLPALNDGVSAWVAYRYTGDPEIYRYAYYAVRLWTGRPCGGTNVPCDKAENVRNVMMFAEANTTKDGVFPFAWPTALNEHDGPTGSDLSALFVAAIFYDLAQEAGLGLHKADLLIWKTISLITNNVTFPMRAFGAKVQEAARALWPDPRPGRAGLSRYEEDVVDVLTSRGIPMNGVADFRTNLPPAIGVFPGSLMVSSANRFGSGHPESQPSVNFYGQWAGFANGYMQTNAAPTNYVAYQFYKHSKYGPCDELRLTDGTFDGTTGDYNNDGSYYLVLKDRELGNLTLLAPGNTIRWNRYRARCPDEATGFYAEDVRPFGFRVIAAMPNGFSFTAFAIAETETNKTYHLAVVDPSVTTLGAATYSWTFTDYLGNTDNAGGSVVSYTALKDQPFTLSIARTRAGVTDTLTLRERGNDLDRNGGQAFVRNLVP